MSTTHIYTDFNAVLESIKQHEEENLATFIVINRDKLISERDWKACLASRKQPQINWESKSESMYSPSIPYTGVPFIYLGTYILGCHLGKDYCGKRKTEYQEKQNKKQMEGHILCRRRQHSKKRDCTATIYVSKIVRFPDIQIPQNTVYRRIQTAQKIRSKLASHDLKGVVEYHVRYPTTHSNHPTPGQNDQEDVAKHLQQWKQPDDCIFFREARHLDDGNRQNFLICFQSSWQKRLLLRYGNDLCLLDATYKTLRYGLPLFFLCVRTNVNYIVVGVFITEHIDQESISEAIQQFKEWNPAWNPKDFLTDYCRAEINAIEDSFEGVTVRLRQFYLERAWNVWMSKADHNVLEYQTELKKMFTDISTSTSEAQYHVNYEKLQQSNLWMSNPKLQEWFSRTWISEKKRWVVAFQHKHSISSVWTTNDEEQQNEVLKFSYLKKYKNGSMTELLSKIINSYLPYVYKKYIQLNVSASSLNKTHDLSVPQFLHDRPNWFTEHISCRWQSDISGEAVIKKTANEFTVISSRHEYHVSLGTTSQLPHCTCTDWGLHSLPCEHMCAVFKYTPFDWWSLPKFYIFNPVFLLDENVLTITDNVPNVESSPIDVYLDEEICIESSEICDGENFCAENDLVNTYVSEFPGKECSSTVEKQRSCMNILKSLTDSVYLLKDTNSLTSLENSLLHLQSKVLSDLPRDNVLVLNSSPLKKIKIQSSVDYQSHGKKAKFIEQHSVKALEHNVAKVNFRY